MKKNWDEAKMKEKSYQRAGRKKKKIRWLELRKFSLISLTALP